jgi:hypothetical protein
VSGIDNEGLRVVSGYGNGGPIMSGWAGVARDPDEVVVPMRPAVRGIRRVFVGGPLNGQVITVAETTTVVFGLAPGVDLDELARGVLNVPGDDQDRPWFETTGLVEYVARKVGNVQLMIEVELTRSADRSGKTAGLTGSIVDALGHASGTHGPSGSALVAQITIREPETD